MVDSFPQNRLVQRNDLHFLYVVPSSSVNALGQVFALLQGRKDSGLIEDYAFSQASLSQVFSMIVKQNGGTDVDHD